MAELLILYNPCHFIFLNIHCSWVNCSHENEGFFFLFFVFLGMYILISFPKRFITIFQNLTNRLRKIKCFWTRSITVDVFLLSIGTLLCKWNWHFERETLWKQVIRRKFEEEEGGVAYLICEGGVWCGVLEGN